MGYVVYSGKIPFEKALQWALYWPMVEISTGPVSPNVRVRTLIQSMQHPEEDTLKIAAALKFLLRLERNGAAQTEWILRVVTCLSTPPTRAAMVCPQRKAIVRSFVDLGGVTEVDKLCGAVCRGVREKAHSVRDLLATDPTSNTAE